MHQKVVMNNCNKVLLRNAPFFLLTLLHFGTALGQSPNWSIDYNQFGIEMTVIVTLYDECVPSADSRDTVAAFDISGQIRGLQATNVDDSIAFMTVGGVQQGELIYFKAYDASTDKFYNIYNTSIAFNASGTAGSYANPIELNFDSNPTNTLGGPDQEVFDMTSTTLEASGSGTWSIVEGADGSFVDSSDPNTEFNGLIDSKYILAWTLTDLDGCIGETDEVIIYFVKDEPEDILRTCTDGLDNDGDGLTDCVDPDCGSPTFTNIMTTLPTPIDCNTSLSDGSFSFTGMGSSEFSIDGGNNLQLVQSFSNLPAGVYELWAQNPSTTCVGTADIDLNSLKDPLDGVTIALQGPNMLCPGLENIGYAVELNKVTTAVPTWTYDGDHASVVTLVDGSLVNFADNATEGMLKVSYTSLCSTVSDSIEIGFGSTFLCGLSNCAAEVNISTPLLQSTNASQVYRAANTLTSDAQLPNRYYEFTAGQSVELESGFSVAQGQVFLADIKSCTN